MLKGWTLGGEGEAFKGLHAHQHLLDALMHQSALLRTASLRIDGLFVFHCPWGLCHWSHAASLSKTLSQELLNTSPALVHPGAGQLDDQD